MNHGDHVALLRDAVAPGAWADLGSGAGAFTLALADLLGTAGTIHSVDRDGTALGEQRRAVRSRFPAADVSYHAADFTRPLELPALEGVVMANSLHFVRRKDEVLAQVLALLRPQGRFVLVEYDADHGNPWVPYPLSFVTWRNLAARNGLRGTRLLHSVPSRFLSRIYSALSIRSEGGATRSARWLLGTRHTTTKVPAAIASTAGGAPRDLLIPRPERGRKGAASAS